MFLETREAGKKRKYYLVHTYRSGDSVKRISRYLGSDLKAKDLERLKARAQQLILEQVKEKNIVEFELTKSEIAQYKRYEKGIKVEHLQKLDWKAFTEEFTYNTNAIEGSTVAKDEVKAILEHREIPGNKDELEAINVANAIGFIKTAKEDLTLDLIKKLHKLCFEKTKAFAGLLRAVEVVIRNASGTIIHRGAPAEKLNKLLKELCDWYNKHKKKYPPLLLAAVVHNQFEEIHPFQDGNGRVGRLLLNYVLLKHGYPPINIRFKDRSEYYACLKRYDERRDIKSTLKFLIRQYKKQR